MLRSYTRTGVPVCNSTSAGRRAGHGQAGSGAVYCSSGDTSLGGGVGVARGERMSRGRGSGKGCRTKRISRWNTWVNRPNHAVQCTQWHQLRSHAGSLTSMPLFLFFPLLSPLFRFCIIFSPPPPACSFCARLVSPVALI